MSDISVLSHEYHTVSELSDAINRALITLKKKRFGLPGAEEIGPEELEQSRVALADITEALLALLAPATQLDVAQSSARARAAGPAASGRPRPPAAPPAPAAAALAQLPASFVARLRTEHSGDLLYFCEDLERLAAQLRPRPGGPLAALTDKDLSLLEQAAAAAAAEASYVFRRLMRT